MFEWRNLVFLTASRFIGESSSSSEGVSTCWIRGLKQPLSSLQIGTGWRWSPSGTLRPGTNPTTTTLTTSASPYKVSSLAVDHCLQWRSCSSLHSLCLITFGLVLVSNSKCLVLVLIWSWSQYSVVRSRPQHHLDSSRVPQLLRRLLRGPAGRQSAAEVRRSRGLVPFAPPFTVLLGAAAALRPRNQLLHRRDRRPPGLHRPAQEGGLPETAPTPYIS